MSTRLFRPRALRSRRERTLERRLFSWMLVLTLVPALTLLAVGGWAVSTSLGVAGALGPWEDVAASGRTVIELAEPVADPSLREALASHRDELSASLTQARRWAFVGERFLAVLPWLVLVVGLTLAGLAAVASRAMARQLARPIEELVVVAEHMGRGEPLPPTPKTALHEVRTLDHALRDAAGRLAEARKRAVTAERLRVWGEMARRVAHEMKNPLTPLRLAVHRLTRSAAPGQGTEEVAQVIADEVGRLEELAAQFSALGRPPEGPATPIDLVELLRSLLELDVPREVATTLKAPDSVPPVSGHYDSLFRAFRNLIRNAVEAMDGTSEPGMTISVRHASGTGGEPGRIEVRILDRGPGLPPDAEGRIFEPDYTTKRRGTGLGLTLVRQAVEADGGSVEAVRRPGGAEFVVRLPVAPSSSAAHSERSEHEPSVR